jgi:hypothetical protein
MDRLKSLVTEPTITIEQKQQPRRSIGSFHRFFTTTNHAHFAHVEADDRRFVFFHVSDKRQGDLTYWKQVHQSINDPAVISAMVYDLERYDLTNFDVRQRPRNEAHMDQKLRSLTGFDRYWYEVLQTGDFDPARRATVSNPWQEPCFVATKVLLEGWKEYEKGTRHYSARQEREVHQALKRLCPSAKQDRKTDSGEASRGKQLPALPDARLEFVEFLGGNIDWGEQ